MENNQGKQNNREEQGVQALRDELQAYQQSTDHTSSKRFIGNMKAKNMMVPGPMLMV